MKKRLLNSLKYILFVGIGGLLVWWQLSRMTPVEKDQFITSLRNVRYIYILPVVIMSLSSHLVRALRWRLLIEPMGYRPSVSNTFYATLSGYFVNTFVPRAGEIFRCTLLGRYENIPFSKLLGTIILERAFDLVCYVILIFITVAIQFGTVRDFAAEKMSSLMEQSGMPLWGKAIIGIAVIFFIYFLFKWLFAKYAQRKFVRKLQEIYLSIREGVSSIMKLKKRRAFLLYTLLMWTLYLIQIYVGFNALEVTEHLGMGAAISVLTLSTLAMIISPGGLGAFPIAVTQVLLIYNIQNISFGWLMWSINTGIILIFGLISLILIIVLNKNNHEEKRLHSGKDISQG